MNNVVSARDERDVFPRYSRKQNVRFDFEFFKRRFGIFEIRFHVELQRLGISAE